MGHHRISLALDSPGSEGGNLPGFEAKLAASGSADVDRRSWAGTLEQASFDFTDGKARLASPVALELGPELVHATPLCLVTGDARLCAEGEWHGATSSWRVLYSARTGRSGACSRRCSAGANSTACCRRAAGRSSSRATTGWAGSRS